MNPEEFTRITEDLKKRKIPPEVKKVVTVMLEKKTEKVIVLKLKGINEITDYMVIGSGNSTRQNNAIADEIQRVLRKEFKLKAFSVEGEMEAEWILLDYIDFVVHILSEEPRKKYALEKLWMDAKRYNFYID
ncbi:MAG: ribosome silencing factor [Acidobacteria bacterium]|jgi:ribosome-associated protein|nr:ribosome silencing factor [Acidobacteriota bacterium]